MIVIGLDVHKQSVTAVAGPVWSPSGNTLAVTSELCDRDQCYGTALRTIAAADGRELMRNSLVDAGTRPAGAPNGKTIALVGVDEENFRLEVGGGELRRQLEARGIVVRCPSNKGLAEEAPFAYKNVERVVEVVERAGLARRVVQLRPLGVVKG